MTKIVILCTKAASYMLRSRAEGLPKPMRIKSHYFKHYKNSVYKFHAITKCTYLKPTNCKLKNYNTINTLYCLICNMFQLLTAILRKYRNIIHCTPPQ